MNRPTHFSLSSALRLTALAGALLASASAASAQSTQLLAPPAGGATTVPYPVGALDPADSGDSYYSKIHFIYAPFTVAAGGTDVTFTATNPGARKSFESFTNDGTYDFPVGTQLVDTGVGDNTTDGNTATSPLRIDFGTGVSAFGLNVQDNAVDQEQFTFTTFSGTNPLNSTTFTTALYDNTSFSQSVFLGAQAVGNAPITSVLISSKSFNDGVLSTNNSNDFYFGPLTATPAVPEPSSSASLGLLVLLCGATLVVAARKKRFSTQN